MSTRPGQLHFDTRSTPSGEFIIRGFASKPVVDRYNEVVDVAAFSDTLDGFRGNPIMLYQHRADQPVGRFTSLDLRHEGLFVEGSIGHGFEPADTARKLIEQKIVKSFSIGFKETRRGVVDKDGIYHIVGLELLEVSIVTIPACSPAVFQHDAGGKLVDVKMIEEPRRPSPGTPTPDLRTLERQLAAVLVQIARREGDSAARRQVATLEKLQTQIRQLEARIALRGLV